MTVLSCVLAAVAARGGETPSESVRLALAETAVSVGRTASEVVFESPLHAVWTSYAAGTSLRFAALPAPLGSPAEPGSPVEPGAPMEPGEPGEPGATEVDERPTWVRTHPAAGLRLGTPRLYLRGVPGQAVARGVLPLSVAADAEPRVLVGADSGCPMTVGARFPLTIGTEVLELPFVWDAHSGLDPTGLTVSLDFQDGTSVRVPIVLEALGRPLRTDARAVAVSAGSTARVELTADAPIGSFRVEREVECCAVSGEIVAPDRLVLEVSATEHSDEPHHCLDLVGAVTLGDDPQPWLFRLSPRHGVDRPQEWRGRFLPEERVEMRLDPDGRSVLVLPDRLPAASAVASAAGYHLIGAVNAPASGRLEAEISGAGRTVVLRGPVDPHASEFLVGWMRADQR